MFKSNAKTADLRLIDFGCAARDSERGAEHETMAGTAFYISPEGEDCAGGGGARLTAPEECDPRALPSWGVLPRAASGNGGGSDAASTPRTPCASCLPLISDPYLTPLVPFALSLTVFQKCYTFKTDVFSAGVVLYVLVGGYPADQLQAAFNLLHKSKRDLKTLPGMPDGMPDT